MLTVNQWYDEVDQGLAVIHFFTIHHAFATLLALHRSRAMLNHCGRYSKKNIMAVNCKNTLGG
jgi:hypothetical protein